MVVNKLRRRLPRREWSITVVDPATEHHYQPGYLFIPFGTYTPDQVTRPLRPTIRSGIELVQAEVERVDRDVRIVHLADGTTLNYDWLVIATGTTPRPAETPGLAEGLGTSVHEFYTLPGATALADALQRFTGGRLVIHVTEMPVKCPVAPLEFAFLVDDHLTGRGIRDAVELTYVTSLPGAFTKPVSAALLGDMLTRRGITLEPDFVVEVPDFLDQIEAAGGHLWACRMSADMNKLTEADLRDDVEGIINASDFIELTAGAQLLFI